MTETEVHEEVKPAPAPTLDEDIADVMQRTVRFAVLRMVGIPGNRQVPGTRLLLGEKELDKAKFSHPTLRLLPAVWREKFNAIKGAAMKLVNNADPRQEAEDDKEEFLSGEMDTLDIPGVSIIVASKMEGVQAALAALSTEKLEPLVEQLKTAWPDILEAARLEVNDPVAWSKLLTTIPKAEALSSSIRILFTPLPITFAGESGRALAETVARRIVLGLTKGIEYEADKIKERVAKEGTFKASTFNGLHHKLSLLKELSKEGLTSPETVQKLREVENTFAALGGAAHMALNENLKSAEKSIVNNVTEVLSNLSREARKDAGGRFKRAIRV